MAPQVVTADTAETATEARLREHLAHALQENHRLRACERALASTLDELAASQRAVNITSCIAFCLLLAFFAALSWR